MLVRTFTDFIYLSLIIPIIITIGVVVVVVVVVVIIIVVSIVILLFVYFLAVDAIAGLCVKNPLGLGAFKMIK